MNVEEVMLQPRTLVGVHELVPIHDLMAYFDRAFRTSFAAIAGHGLAPAGPPIALYSGMPTDTIDVTAGFPISEHLSSLSGAVEVMLPGGPAVAAVHVGPYEALPAAHTELNGWMASHDLTPGLDRWEEYVHGPDTEPNPSKWRTRIVCPLSR